jgi:flagellar biosynthesis protein FliP
MSIVRNLWIVVGLMGRSIVFESWFKEVSCTIILVRSERELSGRTLSLKWLQRTSTFKTLELRTSKHVPWTLELEMLYLGLVFSVHIVICLFCFLILCVLLQFLVKACCSPHNGEGSSASWVGLSLFHFVLLHLHIVCQVKHFLHLAWWLREKMYSTICIKDLYSSIS